MRIRGIDHVQITIPIGAEEAARAFYISGLGLTEVTKPASLQGRGGLWLRVGDRTLHIGTESFDRRTETKAHVAYEVDDIDAWRERITELGCTPEESVPIPGIERFEFRDPFGNRVELLERTGAAGPS